MTDEERRLVARLTVDAAATPERFRRQAGLIFAGAVAVAGIAALRGIWFLVPIALAGGAVIYALGAAAARKTGAYAPVLDALRTAPERVRRISHLETSDSSRMFVSHWVVIETDDATLRVKADDWRELVDALGRRCPGADVKV
jgi:hypothetical protein